MPDGFALLVFVSNKLQVSFLIDLEGLIANHAFLLLGCLDLMRDLWSGTKDLMIGCKFGSFASK